MKKLIIAAFLFVGITTYAQDKKEMPKRANIERMSPEERQERQLKRLTTELTLNVQQQEQIKQLLADQEAKREKQMEINKLSKEEMKAKREVSKKKMLDDRKVLEDKMKTVLTPAQFGTWKTNQEKMREKRQIRIKERRGNKMNNDMEN